LTPEGERVEDSSYPLDDDADIKGMYRDMVLVRRVDTEAIALQRHGELGLWASLLGQEAAQIGSGRALSARDMAFPSYREHGVAWTRGLDPMRLLELFRGVTNGSWDPEEHKFHLYTIVIGDQTLHATGYAMGIQRDGADDEAVIVYFGDGATSQGDVSEAFAWSSVFHAPVVFFCQNNQWAISAPQERQSPVPLYRRASGFGFPGIRVDGNDVLACYAVTKKALAAAREGQGPTLIEAFTYRMGAHTTTDDPTRYRMASELRHGSCGTRSSGSGPTWPGPGRRAWTSSPGSTPRRTSSGRASGRAAGCCPTQPRWSCSSTCTRAATRSWRTSETSTRRTWRASRERGRPDDQPDTVQGHQRGAAPGA
jgi:pyruvate dehydrogenase E1 component alpha subunit